MVSYPMKKLLLFSVLLPLLSFARPTSYTDLLQYSTKAPDQAETNSCLFVGSTGSMEILYNKHFNLVESNKINLAEQYVMWVYESDGYSWLDSVVLGFNRTNKAILNKDLPFYAWNDDGSIHDVWSYPRGFNNLPTIEIPFEVKSKKLFHKGRNRWATYVLTQKDIELVKESLVKYESPVLINYNDEGFWHVINIIGYDDNVEGQCYDYTPTNECAKNKGSFIVRDHFGVATEYRDTDWFRIKGNAAYVISIQ
jgi:hypothetical protein